MKKKKNQTNKKIKKQIMKYILKSKILRKIFKNTVLGIGMYSVGKFVVNKNVFKWLYQMYSWGHALHDAQLGARRDWYSWIIRKYTNNNNIRKMHIVVLLLLVYKDV